MEERIEKLNENIINIDELLQQEKQSFSINYEDNTLEISKGVYFGNETWDFSNEDTLHNRKDAYIYKFDNINDLIYKNLLKKLILREKFKKRNRHTSISITFNDCKKFIIFLENEYPYIKPNMIDSELVIEFLNNCCSHLTEKIKQRTISSLKKFLKEIEFEYEEFNIYEFNNVFSSIKKEKVLKQNEVGKTPNIPRSIFNKIIQIALSDIDNKELSDLDRMISCMILLLSQIGIRRSEVIILEKDRLKELSILNGEKKAYYLEFLTFKTTGNEKGKWTETWMNEISIKAYETLSEIAKKRSKMSVSLYINEKGDNYPTSTFTKHFLRFFVRNQKQLNFNTLSERELKQTQSFVIEEKHIKMFRSFGLNSNDTGKVFYKINPHQFRVAVANELKAKGVSIQWIKNHMNHLEEEMTQHYFRDDTNIKETLFRRSIENGEQLETNPSNIKENEIKMELENPNIKEAYDTINKFLKKKKMNIFKNIDDIIKILKHTTIREEELGFCTKALGVLCERQEKLETFERWYYVRPQFINIENFDFTYKRLVDKMKIVEHNEKVSKENSKYLRQYELETKTLKTFYENKFLPELNSLKEEINKNDKEKIIIQYPNLKEVVEEIDKIERESLKWFQKKKLLNM